jgi:hypothetical protein
VKFKNLLLNLIFSSACGLLKSIYLCLYLTSSFANSPCQSISNGGVFDLDKISTLSSIITSISPVFIFGLACPSGLVLTVQVAFITYSLLRLSAVSHACLLSAGSKTTCVNQYLSRRSINIIHQ